jgi:hypothetical protein
MFYEFWYDWYKGLGMVGDMYLDGYTIENYKEVSEDAELTCPSDDSVKIFDKLSAITYIVKNSICRDGLTGLSYAKAFNRVVEIVKAPESELFSLVQLW